MNRILFSCLAGASLGGLLTVALMNREPGAGGFANEVYAQAATAPAQPATPSAYGTPSPAPGSFTPEELANIRVYEATNRSVVNITTSTVEYDRMFGLPIEGQGSGSGSVLDKQGHILTNNHVIDGAQEIDVTLASGANYRAKLVGADAEYDMAVIKIEAPANELFPIRLGRSDNLRVGQKAYAVGNPFGLEGTLTIGIVSSLNRSVPSRAAGRAMTGMIQTDAAMNPGNSGGPLLNSSAEMIGMNVAIASKIGQNSGVGFAIPVDRVRRFLPELIEHGKVIRAYHGIVTLMETPTGLRIAKISRGGPADQAGLRGFRILRRERRRGPILYTETSIDRDYADTILAIDGAQVGTHTQFLEIMDRYKPGETVTITVLREGQRQQATLTLGAT
ncbi:MAG: trypsin-like peptidase domain-containing protein [Planctomycetota bacterium]